MLRTLSLFLTILASVNAQNKRAPQPADYGQWETLGSIRQVGTLSPDGKWLAYGIDRSNGNNELRLANTAATATKVVAFGADPVFSEDSHWVAYSIGDSEAQRDKLKKDKKPVHNKLGLMNLLTGDQTVVDEIESFAFSPTGSFLAFRRYAPEKKEGPPTPRWRTNRRLPAPP